MVPHAMQLNALVVVNVHVFRLSCGKHLMVLKEADITDLIACLELHDQVFLLPIKYGKMTLLPTEQNMLAISRHRESRVWSKVIES